MNKGPTRSPLQTVAFAGLLLGIFASWLLYRSPNSPPAQAEDKLPDVSHQTTPQATQTTAPAQSVSPTQILPTSQPTAKIGSPAPDFTLEDRYGNPVRLSELRGEIVVLNLWASWCPPCRDEMPDLQSVADEYKDQGLAVIGINTTYMDVRSDALTFIDELKLTFPIVFDETGEVGERSYAVWSLPTSYWIDRDGVVRAVKIGAMTHVEMTEMVDLLLLP